MTLSPSPCLLLVTFSLLGVSQATSGDEALGRVDLKWGCLPIPVARPEPPEQRKIVAGKSTRLRHTSSSNSESLQVSASQVSRRTTEESVCLFLLSIML